MILPVDLALAGFLCAFISVRPSESSAVSSPGCQPLWTGPSRGKRTLKPPEAYRASGGVRVSPVPSLPCRSVRARVSFAPVRLDSCRCRCSRPDSGESRSWRRAVRRAEFFPRAQCAPCSLSLSLSLCSSSSGWLQLTARECRSTRHRRVRAGVGPPGTVGCGLDWVTLAPVGAG